MNILVSFLIGCIKIIRTPLLGPTPCYFVPSCSQFACEQLEKKPLHQALWLIFKRILSCNPFTF